MIRNEMLIPEVYDYMKTYNLVGEYYLGRENNCDSIFWNLSGYLIVISHEYIGIEKRIGILPMQITHWHPDDEDIFENILKIGTKGNVTVIHSTIFGSSVLYSGLIKECPYKRKWLFGKYHYIYAE